LERIVAALEEMQELQDTLSQSSLTEGAVGEPAGDNDSGTGTKTAPDANQEPNQSGDRGVKGEK